MSKRARLYPEIKRLREDEGLMWREIGERLGLSLVTVRDYYSDPDGSKVRARKMRNARQCRDCGVTINTDGRVTNVCERCVPCNTAHIRAASKAWIIDRMRAWAERFGDPPCAIDWNRAPSSRSKSPAAALRQDDAADEEWPSTASVQCTFGSWNAAIEAAGFASVPPGVQRTYPGARRAAA